VSRKARVSRKQRRSFTRAFKLAAVQRMASTESIVGLADELGVQRRLLYSWRDHLQTGGSAALRRAGRPPRADAAAIEAPIAPADVSDPAEARRRIEELERKIGQQQLELDFFRAALRHVKEPRPQRPSVPMKVRHPTPGNLHLWARKDDLAYAHAPDRQRRGDRRRQERRP
jgi:transposase